VTATVDGETVRVGGPRLLEGTRQAGVILASSDPRSVLSVIQLSKASYRKMKQNPWWAAGYNLI
jgi:hypothetical protein